MVSLIVVMFVIYASTFADGRILNDGTVDELVSFEKFKWSFYETKIYS